MTPDPTTLSPIFNMVPVGYAIGIMVMMAVLMTALAVIGYFIRDLKQSLADKDREQDNAIDGLRRDFQDFRAKMPETYVLREDWIRTTTGFYKKLDDVAKQIRCIDRKISRHFGDKEGADG